MINELIEKNKDFAEFVENATENIGMEKKHISPRLYDEILSDKQIAEHIKKLQIARI